MRVVQSAVLPAVPSAVDPKLERGGEVMEDLRRDLEVRGAEGAAREKVQAKAREKVQAKAREKAQGKAREKAQGKAGEKADQDFEVAQCDCQAWLERKSVDVQRLCLQASRPLG